MTLKVRNQYLFSDTRTLRRKGREKHTSWGEAHSPLIPGKRRGFLGWVFGFIWEFGFAFCVVFGCCVGGLFVYI